MGKRRILVATGPRDGVRTTRMVVPRELQVSRQRIVYFEAGMGAPVILLHGLGASSRWWFPIIPELSSANCRVIALDLPGFGRTPGPMLSIKKTARTVIELVDRAGLAEFFLVGHSMGGAIAAQIGADFGRRVRRLALVDSAGIPGAGPGRILGRLIQPWSWCPAWFYTTMLSDILRAGPSNIREGMRQLRIYDVRPVLGDIRAPTLLIWGEKDGMTPLRDGEQMVERLKNGRIETVAGARHLPMVSHPEIVSALLVRFFKEDLKARS